MELNNLELGIIIDMMKNAVKDKNNSEDFIEGYCAALIQVILWKSKLTFSDLEEIING